MFSIVLNSWPGFIWPGFAYCFMAGIASVNCYKAAALWTACVVTLKYMHAVAALLVEAFLLHYSRRTTTAAGQCWWSVSLSLRLHLSACVYASVLVCWKIVANRRRTLMRCRRVLRLMGCSHSRSFLSLRIVSDRTPLAGREVSALFIARKQYRGSDNTAPSDVIRQTRC